MALPLLITYDLQDAQYEGALLDYLKKQLGATMVTKSAYVTLAKKTPTEIAAEIKKLTQTKIVVYIVSVCQPADGYGPTATNEYLGTALPKAPP